MTSSNKLTRFFSQIYYGISSKELRDFKKRISGSLDGLERQINVTKKITDAKNKLVDESSVDDRNMFATLSEENFAKKDFDGLKFNYLSQIKKIGKSIKENNRLIGKENDKKNRVGPLPKYEDAISNYEYENDLLRIEQKTAEKNYMACNDASVAAKMYRTLKTLRASIILSDRKKG